MMAVDRRQIPSPIVRKLRTFAVDPGMTARFETALLNEMTLSIPWEPVSPGPVGEYIAVIDEDETGERKNAPLDLNQPDLLAQDGLAPSDGNPQFRQQMVYAVAMRTIRNFERALGRAVHWPPSFENGSQPVYQPRLRLYPHYNFQANAYYSPEGGSLYFGCFVSADDSPFPGTSIFTCLSQDIVAHELSHAVLSGMGVEFSGSHPDVPALHEAFSDLVPLLQHFWKSDVLRAQIAAIRGDLQQRSALGAVALQFGQAMGRKVRKFDGLRNALGFTDDKGVWQPRSPDPKRYLTAEEPHDRGDILVAAVFDAMRKIYESRVADLKRLATRGTGVLPAGNLHPDLVARLTHEVSETAGQVLDMCIRALDYLPAVNATFGDYLRAIITADYELDPLDERHSRVAFVEAFRSHGIFPSDVGTLSIETLLWPRPATEDPVPVVSEFVRTLARRHAIWDLPREREALWRTLEDWRNEMRELLKVAPKKGQRPQLGSVRLDKPFEIVSFQPRQRIRFNGALSAQWIVKIVQPPPGAASSSGDGEEPALSGCTLVINAQDGSVKYQIDKAPLKARQPKAPRLPVLTPVLTPAPPSERRLRVFAFDPSFGVSVDTAGINEIVLRVPWERDAKGVDILTPGPVGEYVEVIDRDPASGCFYAPVDLNDSRLLAQDGLAPSESNPQFHQAMVYAVTMRTIRTFESALGRLALWSPRRVESTGPDGRKKIADEYVQRLRIYPHALREANAFYSPTKKAVLFGYFPSPAADGLPESRLTVFTCLSHDIIAHEVTHALLDGMHRRFREASNPDVLAFHEAFADIVALFQHFSLPEVLRHQIAATRGDLSSQNRLGELAQQFGQAIGNRGALRSALGAVDPVTHQWKPATPDPDALRRLTEPHDRGAVLVAAVFDAFLTIYKGQVADLLRIATDGTGILPEGYLHPDLVNRLSDEAAQSARHVLNMCIRALDYCPPVDLTMGDYLRAIVTADYDFDPTDASHRSVAFVEAFRRHGIAPADVRTLSVDGLLWPQPSAAAAEDGKCLAAEVRTWTADVAEWAMMRNRKDLFELMRRKRGTLHDHIDCLFKNGGAIGGIDPALRFEVHSIRPSLRSDWEGRPRFQWVIELTQRIPQRLDGEAAGDPAADPDYYFRGGCTLIVDAESGGIRYSIEKALDEERKERQRRYVLEQANENLAGTYFGGVAGEMNEPFAMLHRL
jgi:hypothetical protein